MALQSSQAPPGEGCRTVGEVECHFLVRNSGEEDVDFVAAPGVNILPVPFQTIPDPFHSCSVCLTCAWRL